MMMICVCVAETTYEEQCRLLLDKKQTMLTKYRQLLLLESMVWSHFSTIYHWS